jgi:hypothetical protein
MRRSRQARVEARQRVALELGPVEAQQRVSLELGPVEAQQRVSLELDRSSKRSSACRSS